MPVSMEPSANYSRGWNEQRLLLRGPLTDKKIERYAKSGSYNPNLREFRKQLYDLRKAKRERASIRSGNFDLLDGRMIFRPL